MKTIEERAREYCHREKVENVDCLHAYTIGATEQRAIDIEKACEWIKSNFDSDEGGEIELCFRKVMEE